MLKHEPGYLGSVLGLAHYVKYIFYQLSYG